MEYDQFTSLCDQKRCPRRTIYNAKTCLRDSKRQTCYEKFLLQWEKKQAKYLEVVEQGSDPEYERLVVECWKRDAGVLPSAGRHLILSEKNGWKVICRFWKCLTDKEKIFLDECRSDLYHLNKEMDVAHIKGKGERPDLKYELDNVVLISRAFHSALDTYIDPVTGKSMTAEQREQWFERIKGLTN